MGTAEVTAYNDINTRALVYAKPGQLRNINVDRFPNRKYINCRALASFACHSFLFRVYKTVLFF